MINLQISITSCCTRYPGNYFYELSNFIDMHSENIVILCDQRSKVLLQSIKNYLKKNVNFTPSCHTVVFASVTIKSLFMPYFFIKSFDAASFID